MAATKTRARTLTFSELAEETPGPAEVLAVIVKDELARGRIERIGDGSLRLVPSAFPDDVLRALASLREFASSGARRAS